VYQKEKSDVDGATGRVETMSAGVARAVYVISDLHLGGTYGKTSKGRGFRINTHVNELSEFVEALAEKPASGPKIELVINGDMVDFLAEREDAPPFWNPFTCDAEAACAKLQAIADRDRPFFNALGTFLDKNHRLTVLTGNHDIELVLPPVRLKLEEVIGVKPCHDYQFIYNGEAYQAGDALIEHGNRYDQWNVVNYDGLRRLSSLISRRQPIPEKYDFEPPAGSKMVAWVINEIKEDYKFIDLLKPETDIAVPLLLALEPGYRQMLATIAKLAFQTRDHRMEAAALPSFGGDIHAGGDSASAFGSDISTYSGGNMEESSPASDDEAALEQVLRDRLPGDSGAFLEALAPAGNDPGVGIGSDISTANIVDRTMGLAKLLFSRDDQDIGRRLPALLKALQVLQPDRNFDLDYETAPEYTDAAKELFKGGFRFVLFGHTHMAKKIELQPGCWYLNSGTWSDLMRLPPEILTASEADARKQLDPFVQDIGAGLLDRWIVFRPTYIQLDLDAGGHVINAELRPYESAAAMSG
jgi:UDP-2,3-diacylglucosamine pyrophosphatase LpxH